MGGDQNQAILNPLCRLTPDLFSRPKVIFPSNIYHGFSTNIKGAEISADFKI